MSPLGTFVVNIIFFLCRYTEYVDNRLSYSVKHVGICQTRWLVSSTLISIKNVGISQTRWHLSNTLASVKHVGRRWHVDRRWHITNMSASVKHVDVCQTRWHLSNIWNLSTIFCQICSVRNVDICQTCCHMCKVFYHTFWLLSNMSKAVKHLGICKTC